MRLPSPPEYCLLTQGSARALALQLLVLRAGSRAQFLVILVQAGSTEGIVLAAGWRQKGTPATADQMKISASCLRQTSGLEPLFSMQTGFPGLNPHFLIP
jgi:hypothetical protein